VNARFEALGVVVSDIPAAVRFYSELGLEFPEDTGQGHLEATVAGVRFMLDSEETIRSFDPDWQPPSGGQRVGLAFRCDTPAEVDSAFVRLQDVGGSVHREPWDAPWGMRYAQVKDPDGTVVDLFSDL
jgi:uncharacterized glyoxalase superfamily protein PhnB